eukprot:337624_1
MPSLNETKHISLNNNNFNNNNNNNNNKLKLVKSRSDIKPRKYRSKYTKHYKITLANHNNNNNNISIRKNNRSNSECVYDLQSNNNNNNNNNFDTLPLKNGSNKKKRKRRKLKKKSKSEKYKIREKDRKKGIMHHLRSRSHSLANIKSSNNEHINKEKHNGKHNEYIKYKCVLKSKKHNGKHNGIIGIYITKIFIVDAYNFWNINISSFNVREFREASTLFFSHLMVNMSSNNKILMKHNNIIEAPLKYFDMIGWLLRTLNNNNINAYYTLKHIGEIHLNKYNVSLLSFYAMLNSLHIIFSELFQKEYNLRIKYIFDIVFISCIFIMIGS